MEFVARLFPEARARQRQRRARVVGLVSAALAAAAITLAATARPPSPPAPPPISAPAGTPVLAPAAVFGRDPYMGVRCGVPNSIACDALGLAVWLKRPARRVTATIDGRALTLDQVAARGAGLGGSPPVEFDGYLRPAGLRTNLGVTPAPGTQRWLGNPTPTATVWLLIDDGPGRRALTHAQVPLMAGWG